MKKFILINFFIISILIWYSRLNNIFVPDLFLLTELFNIDNIVLETDSPYLAPKPFRGKRNESKYILNIAQKLSEIYNIDIQEIANITTCNANKLFNL